MNRHSLLLALWSAASLILLAALLPALDATGGDLAAAIGGAPWSMFATVMGLTVLNLAAGAQKWRISTQLFGTAATKIGMLAAFESTALGAFLGQVAPMQLTTAAVRALLARRTPGGARLALGTTLHEQTFDLIALIAAVLTAAAVHWVDSSASLAVIAGFVVAAALLGLMQSILRMGSNLASRLAGRSTGPARQAMRGYASALAVAAEAPAGIVVKLVLLSVVRIALLTTRTTVIAIALAPSVTVLDVVLAYPVVAIIMAIPLTPAGLGVVEWSWAAVLIAAGASPDQAAITALSFRIVNLLALAAVLAVLGLMRLGVRERRGIG